MPHFIVIKLTCRLLILAQAEGHGRQTYQTFCKFLVLHGFHFRCRSRASISTSHILVRRMTQCINRICGLHFDR